MWERPLSPPSLNARDAPKLVPFVRWQRQLVPLLPDFDADELRKVLDEADKWLPLVPEQLFMETWLKAADRVMDRMSHSAWMMAEKLGARPSAEYLQRLALVARDRQLNNPNWTMFETVDLLYRWGGRLQQLRPLLETWETNHTRHMRERGHVHFITATVLADLGYVPSVEFVHEWVRAAEVTLPILRQHTNGTAFWNLLNSTLRVPCDDVSVFDPLLEAWIAQGPHFAGVSEKRLVGTLSCMADVGYQPPEYWIKEIADELLKRLPNAQQPVALVRFLADLATPGRDSSAVTAFVHAWVAATQGTMSSWHADALVGSLAAMVRMQMGPGEIGDEWFRKWLQAAQSLAGRQGGAREYEGQLLLKACRAAATRIFVPLEWIDLSFPATVKAARAVRQLRTMRTLRFDDAALLRSWVDIALSTHSFRSYQVAAVARCLRDLSAEDMAQEWERRTTVSQ